MKIMLIAGNGLSLAMLKEKPVAAVDLSNLFAMGCDVSWPATGKPGFLSYEHCPNLWALGARQTATAKTAYDVIEQVISAANACCLADPASLPDGIYIRAYHELVAYLRHLFVHYDAVLRHEGFFDDPAVTKPIDWLLKAAVDMEVTDVDVVSFNYDAFLERCFQARGVEFEVPLLDPRPTAKVRVHKPHGSITFCGKVPIDKTAFRVDYQRSFSEGGIGQFVVNYEDLDQHYPVVGMLPPAGESDRYEHRWIRQIWTEATEAAKRLAEGDLVVIYGLSYWHVDRMEVDKLLGAVPRNVRVVSVNPAPHPHFEAVCCSLFRSYHSYAAPNQLARMVK